MPASADPTPARRPRRRWLVFVVALLAGLALLQAGLLHRFERQRAIDAEIADRAGDERNLAQQIGRFAALAASGWPDAATQAPRLRQSLDLARAQATLVEAAVAGQAAQEREPSAPVVQALADWKRARELLWARCDRLLIQLAERSGGDLASAAAEVQRLVEPALDSASRLGDALQADARARSSSRLRQAEACTALILGLLALAAMLGAGTADRAEEPAAGTGSKPRIEPAGNPSAIPTDPLTGLPDRGVVLDRLQRAISLTSRRPGCGFAVLFLDIDRFRQVNDTLGHAAGDELLRQIARRIEDTLRPGDAVARVVSELPVAARVGGDEFAVVLERIRDTEDARAVAQRLLDDLSQPYLVGSQIVHSGVSVGIVCPDGPAAAAEDVLRDADIAMFEAKRAGRGRCVVFDRSMHERVLRSLEAETDLRRALREGELFVVYQPVVELAGGAMVGVEALLRWRHPRLGIVPPDLFIAVAEEGELIGAVGQRLLESACAQFAAWRRELGPRAPRLLALHLVRAQLEQPGLASDLRRVIEHSGVAAGELEIEVSDGLAGQDEQMLQTLGEFKAMGLRLALDDFGTGRSSLAGLRRLPVDTVKIDRSLVTHAEDVEYHRVLIEATIRVAQTLGMTTVAEGIETATQAALLASLGCDRGQGKHFGAPLAAEEFARWVRAEAAASAPADVGA